MKNQVIVTWIWALMTVGIFAAGLQARPASAEQSGTFHGSWIASGKRHMLDYMADRDVFTFAIEGHLNLTDHVGQVRDFWSTCIGLWDSQTGGTARCVWRSPQGNDIYSVLSGELLKEGVAVQGEFVGGTGQVEGIEGTFSLTWQSIFFNEDERVLTLHAQDVTGTYRIP